MGRPAAQHTGVIKDVRALVYRYYYILHGDEGSKDSTSEEKMWQTNYEKDTEDATKWTYDMTALSDEQIIDRRGNVIRVPLSQAVGVVRSIEDSAYSPSVESHPTAAAPDKPLPITSTPVKQPHVERRSHSIALTPGNPSPESTRKSRIQARYEEMNKPQSLAEPPTKLQVIVVNFIGHITRWKLAEDKIFCTSQRFHVLASCVVTDSVAKPKSYQHSRNFS